MKPELELNIWMFANNKAGLEDIENALAAEYVTLEAYQELDRESRAWKKRYCILRSQYMAASGKKVPEPPEA